MATTTTSRSSRASASRSAWGAPESSPSLHACRSLRTATARWSASGSRRATASFGDEMAYDLGEPFISTGQLPSRQQIQALVLEAHERFRSNADGVNSDVYPVLTRTRSDLFGICVVESNGEVHAAGDALHEFAIMSVSKPFVFALVCEHLGPEEVRRRVGVNSTGLAFNSLAAVERGPEGRTNPMVNAGAIAVTSLVPGRSAEEKWRFIQAGLSRFAGRPLSLNDEVYGSASETNHRK